MGRMMINPGIQSVVFDFDYTLADSSEGIIESANYALRRLGLPAASDDKIRRTIGMSLQHTLTALAGGEYAGHGDEFQRLFIERADDVMHDSTVMFEFVSSLVDALLSNGIRLGIVSSKGRWRIEKILRRDGLDVRFAVIVGGEDVEVLKPDPSGLLRAVTMHWIRLKSAACMWETALRMRRRRGGQIYLLLPFYRGLRNARSLPNTSRSWCWGVRRNCRLHWESTQAIHKEGLAPARWRRKSANVNSRIALTCVKLPC